MPFSLKMPAGLAGWRIVIHDLERLEEAPHVNVIKDGCKWRIRLDDGSLMDREQPGCKMHKLVRKVLNRNWDLLKREWNRIHPSNPINETPDDEMLGDEAAEDNQ